MAAANYDDVLDQLRGAGLLVSTLETGRMVRCRVEGGDRERRGWYTLHELQTQGGDLLIVGSYGVWHGNDNQAQKVELRKREISADEREALRKRMVEDRKRAAAAQRRVTERAAARASAAWRRYAVDGDSDYLARKGVQAFGLRFTSQGSAVLPLLDTNGRIHGLQFLRTPAQAEATKRPAKEFWPAGLGKKGHFHLIGAPQHLVLVAEGYATAATLHMATGYPVAVAFDAGNLAPVAEALRRRYKDTRVLVCADDDALGKCRHATCRARVALVDHPTDCPACGEPHGITNAGVAGASAAALAINGAWLVPTFADDARRRAQFVDRGAKATDFNDLHAAEGLHVVRTQVEARLSELGWHTPKSRAASPPTEGGGADDKLRPIEDVEELLERYPLIYGHGSAVFDRREHIIVSLSDMRDACIRKDIHRAWAESPRREIVRISEVGFDPTECDPRITCNLFGGWPTIPQPGACGALLELLEFMCQGDSHPRELFAWVLKWIAYPLQHPGAKMKTTLVLHGPQGTGKNMFFEALMAIYGQYGDVIDQSAVEDKFNDWASRKLFMIADEVVARSDLYHVKNKLKGLITGDRILINPKGFKSYWERNHLNLVFLSNETMPVVLEEDDRRHCIIWTPPPLEREFYARVKAEIDAGGVAALHDYLLHLDLGDFSNATAPPQTDAKAELVGLSLDSPSRFFYELTSGEIPKITPRPCLSEDLYELYRTWCGKQGVKPAPSSKFINALQRKHDARKERKRYYNGFNEIQGPHNVIFPGEYAPPDGQAETGWLGQQIMLFKSALDEYRGRA